MQKDGLDGLLALKLVAGKKNFSAAAAELGVSPPAVSKMIKLLEGRLGVTLLSRTTRSTSLTEAGVRFLGQAGPALDQILAAIADANTQSTRPTGHLRINLPRAAYPTLLAPLIASFIQKHPEMSVELSFDDGLSDVVEDGFDAGIRLSEMMAKDMVALKLFGPVRFVAVGSPKYFNRTGRPKHPKDLLNHACILLRTSRTDLYDRWEFESKGKEIKVQVTGRLVLNDTSLVVNAALEGSGVTYYAEDLIRDKIAAGKLEVVLAPYAATSNGFFLYYPKRSQVLPKLRAFVDHLKAAKQAP